MSARRCRFREWIRRFALLASFWFLAVGTGQLGAGTDDTSTAGVSPLHFAMSDTAVKGVTLSDARAAMSVWIQEILSTLNLKAVAPSGQDWVIPTDQLLESIRSGKVDMFTLTVQEYRQVAPYVDATRIITDDYGGEELLLVVRDGGGIANLAGLRGRSLILLESPTTSLAEPWLTVSLWQDGLASPKQFLGRMSRNPKLAQVVLPVFFGQIDACVVTRRGLDTMEELNPQLARKLKILLASPPMESRFFGWRRNASASTRNAVFDKLVTLKTTPATQQVLTLFQSPGLAARDAGCLKPAIALLDAYEHHRALAPGGTN